MARGAAVVIYDQHREALRRAGERGAVLLRVVGPVPRILREEPA